MRRNSRYDVREWYEFARNVIGRHHTYQIAILEGRARLSGSDLRGRAMRYKGRYNASAAEALRKLKRAGIPYRVVGGTTQTGPARVVVGV